jgi:hypothetical protein
VLSASLLVGRLSTVSLAQTSDDLSTYSVAHQASFHYPASWDVILDGTHITAVPAEPYGDGDAIGIQSPDGVAEIDFRIYGNTHSALQDVQSLIDADVADASGHPNFRLIAPPATAQVSGADNAAAAEYVFTRPDGSLGHYFQLYAARGGIHYQLQAVAADAQLAPYQSQLNQILQSFQLLP